MIYTWTGTSERPRIDVQLSSSSSTKLLRKIHHNFKCGGIYSNINISLDSVAPHRRSSSSSELLKREDCFTLPRAEQVRRPLSRYLARKESDFTLSRAKFVLVSVSLSRCTQDTSHDCFQRYHAQSEFIQLISRCAHEERPKPISVLTHAVSFKPVFTLSREKYHTAKAPTTASAPYIIADSVSHNRPHLIVTRERSD